MNLEDLGNIGDFAGGLGVIVTLIYLATQIRQNTRQLRQNADLARLAALDATNVHGQHARSDLVAPGAAEVFLAGLEGRPLPEADTVRFRLYLQNFLYGMQGIFLREAILHDGNWPSMEAGLLRNLDTPGGIKSWRYLRSGCRPDFRAEVERILARNGVTVPEDDVSLLDPSAAR